MNLAELKISINEGIKYLEAISLFKGKGYKGIGEHSAEFIKVTRKNRHVELYDVAIKNGDYEILLSDDSIFQFSINGDTVRYAFIQNPNLYLTKEDFLVEFICTPEEIQEMQDDEIKELIASINEEEYEQFLNEQELNLQSHILRYDLDSNGYYPLVHSHSHIHVGLNQNVRIPCSKFITPCMFILFSIKHTYYEEWKDSFSKITSFETMINEKKNKCLLLTTNWDVKEGFELFLS